MSLQPNVPEKVLQLLRAGGWTEKAGRDDFVAKHFETAVGVKAASAWCWPGDDGRHWIGGSYYSEGRDVLASCGVCIFANADDASIAAAAERFLGLAQREVEGTYAMRLMRPSAS
ncbi:hypothetical protein [Methylibium petroleiphilum]|uniref:Uncharacterized protein n=1 Tax=Methylibium petroleiphilum (strain ATCC BAA-1232 / LMG 22953 / PM1) TaxID=420662 RepID=A2SNF2_METPP|nr:hypothetical protein [Methylibium petroleiphilum]ABM97091.1 hypothetical protein Mpe_B0316 [Methylibium petroleiphilum PM1]